MPDEITMHPTGAKGVAEQRWFDSLGSMLAPLPDIYGDRRGHRDDRPNPWRYGQDWPDGPSTRRGLLEGRSPAAVRAFLDQARDQIDESATAAEFAEQTPRRRRVLADDGDEIEMSRYLTGHPECWQTTKRGHTGMVIKLGINIAVSCGNGPQDFARYIARCAVAADALQAIGWGVEIIGLEIACNAGGPHAGGWHALGWPMKRADEPTDIERLCSLAAPGVFRWACFSYCFSTGSSNSFAYEPGPPQRAWLRENWGIQYLFTQSWRSSGQFQMMDGVREILKAADVIDPAL